MPQGRARWLSSRRRRRPSPPSPQRGATALPAARSSPRRARRSRKTSTSSWTRSTTSWRRTPRSSSRATCSGAASNECRSTSTAASSASRSSRSTSPAPRPSSRVPAAPASRSCASYRSSASKPPARSSRPPCRAAAAAAAAVPVTDRRPGPRLLLMDLRRLEIFAKVAELGSFSRAAEALFLTQPTISEHIRALEDELSVQLLDRLGRGATTTRAGDLMLGYARRMLALSREARQALDQFQGRLSGQLVVGGSTIPGEYLLPALIGQFKAKYPDISISLLIGDSRQVTTWVEDARAEVAVVGARPGPRTPEPSGARGAQRGCAHPGGRLRPGGRRARRGGGEAGAGAWAGGAGGAVGGRDGGGGGPARGAGGGGRRGGGQLGWGVVEE